MTRKSTIRKSKTARPARRATRSLRAKKPDALETLLLSSVDTLALPIEAAWQAEVKRNLKLLFTHAALIDAFSLPDESEPAPVFRA